MMRLCVVVAANGLGHFRRAVRLLHGLLDRARSSVQVTLVAEAWQRQAVAGWTLAESLWRRGVALASGVMAPGVGWSRDAATFDDGRLMSWEQRLAALPAFREASHVWSDNLAGVLGSRKDALLSGSFLWSDVLEALQTPAVARFVEHERSLLAACRPPMLGVEPLAMAGVRSRTNAVLVPWMCEWQRVDAPRTAVGVLGGRTGAASDRLAVAARSLEGRWQVVGDDGLSHDATGYAGLAAAIVRPGAGSITDCVASAVPMLLLDDPDNPELRHNARAVERLGLGRVLPAGDESRAADWIAEMTDSAAGATYAEAFAAQRKDGVAVAVDWLLQHLKLESV